MLSRIRRATSTAQALQVARNNPVESRENRTFSVDPETLLVGCLLISSLDAPDDQEHSNISSKSLLVPRDNHCSVFVVSSRISTSVWCSMTVGYVLFHASGSETWLELYDIVYYWNSLAAAQRAISKHLFVRRSTGILCSNYFLI
jgi:hypothetical protein